MKRPEGITDQALRTVLTRAHHRIAEYESNMICLALNHAYGHNKKLARACNYLQNFIEEQLDGFGSYKSWLEHELQQHISPEQARIGRLAWIDWMLEGLK
jgi:hypothetical protein